MSYYRTQSDGSPVFIKLKIILLNKHFAKKDGWCNSHPFFLIGHNLTYYPFKIIIAVMQNNLKGLIL